MSFPERHTIAIRAHDMHHGLSTHVSGLIAKVKRTRLVGACAQLCTVLKDQEVIQDYQQLEVAAGEIGIDDATLEKCLTTLEEVEFVHLRRSGGAITRIDISIPLLRSIYTQLGEYWTNSNPSEFEKLNVAILDELALVPQPASLLQKEHNLDARDMDLLRDLGRGAAYLGAYTSRTDGQEIWYSPLHWDEHPTALADLTERHPTASISAAIRGVRDHQGMPVDLSQGGVLADALILGCLPTAWVTSLAGRKDFVFAPIAGLAPDERSILNKARAIVSCVRYGQQFGTITKIDDPAYLLEVLKYRKYLRPHTEILRQYETLRDLGVGRIIPAKHLTDRYSFHLIDNPENMKALDLAIQMLRVGDLPHDTGKTDRARQLLLPGIYQHPTAVRAAYVARQHIPYSRTTVERVNDLIRGVSSDLIEE